MRGLRGLVIWLLSAAKPTTKLGNSSVRAPSGQVLLESVVSQVCGHCNCKHRMNASQCRSVHNYEIFADGTVNSSDDNQTWFKMRTGKHIYSK